MAPLAQRTSSPGGFELALPASTPGAIALPELVPGSPPPQLTVPFSSEGGLVLRVPQGLRPRTPAEGARGLTLTIRYADRELAHQTCRFSELGGVIGVRSGIRLPSGDYALRVSADSASASEPAQVWSWTLRVR
jgi:hypothetical protein